MQNVLEDTTLQSGPWSPPAKRNAAPLPEVLWRRRSILIVSLMVTIVAACVYLVHATRIYSASARIVVEQNGPRPLGQGRDGGVSSEAFLQTQVEVVQSFPVMLRAYNAAKPRMLHTFEDAGKDPVSWLRSGHGLKVELGKKSDVIVVTMESAYRSEAVEFANCVVDAYIAEQTQSRQATSDGMLKTLQNEKSQTEHKRDDLIASMQKYRRDNGILELHDSNGNTILQRASSLATSLTETETQVMELKAELAGTQAALGDAASTAAFVEAQQQKNRDTGDHELDDLRTQRLQNSLLLTSSEIVQGSNAQRVKVLQATIDSINRDIADKEGSMGQALLVSCKSLLAAAQVKEDELRAALKKQTETALSLSPESYANAQADVARLEKSLDVLDNRITELTVNKTTEAGPLDISIMEPATLEERPVKPNALMILAAAIFVGAIGGIGVAVAREATDLRLRSPAEVRSLLSMRLVTSVPPIPDDFSAVARGQIVRLDARSAVAEAYRSVRTTLHLGTKLVSKTLLFVSPSSGEGKSTTASNVALAFAKAGERTLLLDCDLREPVQHLIFEVDGDVGLTDVISGTASLRDTIRATEVPGLFILPCGPVPINPSEVLASKRFARLMQALGKTFDRIIIDSPPLLNVTDGCILAAAADVTMMVLRMGVSTHEGAVLALDHLEKVDANVLGVVANGVPTPRAYRYYGTASNYATHANRRMSTEGGLNGNGLDHGNGDGNGNGNGNGNGRHERPAQDSFMIEEPQWAAD